MTVKEFGYWENSLEVYEERHLAVATSLTLERDEVSYNLFPIFMQCFS